MYKLIVRNERGSGDAIFYDPKTSNMNWFTRGAPVNDTKVIEINSHSIDDFIISIQTKRKVESLENYKKFREECHHCPVVQLCKGILPCEDWTEKCNKSYIENTSNLYWAIFALTGKRLESITGNIRRPE